MPPKSHKSTNTPSRQGSTPRLFPVLMIILTALSLVGLFHAVSAESSKDPAARDRGPSKSRAVQDLKSIAPAGQPGGIGGSTETSSAQGWQQENNNLTTNNKVGINTTTPLSALHVKGDLTIEEGNVKGSRTPVNGSDLATREYVDGKVGGPVGAKPFTAGLGVYTADGSKYLGKFLGYDNGWWMLLKDGARQKIDESIKIFVFSNSKLFYSDSSCSTPTVVAGKIWQARLTKEKRSSMADGSNSVTCITETAQGIDRSKYETKKSMEGAYYSDNGVCKSWTSPDPIDVLTDCKPAPELLCAGVKCQLKVLDPSSEEELGVYTSDGSRRLGRFLGFIKNPKSPAQSECKNWAMINEVKDGSNAANLDLNNIRIVDENRGDCRVYNKARLYYKDSKCTMLEYAKGVVTYTPGYKYPISQGMTLWTNPKFLMSDGRTPATCITEVAFPNLVASYSVKEFNVAGKFVMEDGSCVEAKKDGKVDVIKCTPITLDTPSILGAAFCGGQGGCVLK